MPSTESPKRARHARMTITLPADLASEIKRAAGDNQSGFLAAAARRELRRRQRKALLAALDAHEQTDEFRALESAGLAEYAANLPPPAEIDESAFEPIQWVRGQGWIKP